jgi:hypothetical protein
MPTFGELVSDFSAANSNAPFLGSKLLTRNFSATRTSLKAYIDGIYNFFAVPDYCAILKRPLSSRLSGIGERFLGSKLLTRDFSTTRTSLKA